MCRDASYYLMPPTSHLFEVEPPRRVSKLSRRNTRRIAIMPPRARKNVVVCPKHPDNVAAAAKKMSRGVYLPLATSPPRAAKSQANERIIELCYRNPRTPVASEDHSDGSPTASVPFPPTCNAWWCGGCRAMHFVGDGGDLEGACIVCGDRNPV